MFSTRDANFKIMFSDFSCPHSIKHFYLQSCKPQSFPIRSNLSKNNFRQFDVSDDDYSIKHRDSIGSKGGKSVDSAGSKGGKKGHLNRKLTYGFDPVIADGVPYPTEHDQFNTAAGSYYSGAKSPPHFGHPTPPSPPSKGKGKGKGKAPTFHGVQADINSYLNKPSQSSRKQKEAAAAADWGSASASAAPSKRSPVKLTPARGVSPPRSEKSERSQRDDLVPTFQEAEKARKQEKKREKKGWGSSKWDDRGWGSGSKWDGWGASARSASKYSGVINFEQKEFFVFFCNCFERFLSIIRKFKTLFVVFPTPRWGLEGLGWFVGPGSEGPAEPDRVEAEPELLPRRRRRVRPAVRTAGIRWLHQRVEQLSREEEQQEAVTPAHAGEGQGRDQEVGVGRYDRHHSRRR